MPKPMKVWLCTKRSSHFTAMKETMAATTAASASIAQSGVGAPGFGASTALAVLNAPAASRVGMPTRKENSVAATRFVPQSRLKMMVEPERESPGKMAAASWPIAVAMVAGHVTIRALFAVGEPFFRHDEEARRRRSAPRPRSRRFRSVRSPACPARGRTRP